MKLISVLLLSALCGCARFGTTQTDISYDSKGNKQREITTHASTCTLFDSTSKLTNFKASQTDKTQSAVVGALEQSASGTNFVQSLKEVKEIIQALPTN